MFDAEGCFVIQSDRLSSAQVAADIHAGRADERFLLS